MFCYQCEQTAQGIGCTTKGICGKNHDVAALQDLTIYMVKGISQIAIEALKKDISDKDINGFICEAIFSTLTNVNFDSDRFINLIEQATVLRDKLKNKLALAGGNVNFTKGPALFTPAKTKKTLVEQGTNVNFKLNNDVNADIVSLRELIVYGVKGLAAYTHHAKILGFEDNKIYNFIHEAMASTIDNNIKADHLIKLALKCGKINLLAMKLLDAGNTGRYGHPVPTNVPLSTKKGKSILVSGHDLKSLEMILEQTEGKHINVYTHGEMLPCHAYPNLKKYSHFYGHYGTAWQNQKKEFADFPGAIVINTNCIQKPKSTYLNNIFTCGLVGWPGVRHIVDGNFSPAIEKTLEMQGFLEDSSSNNIVTTGFGRNSIINIAPEIIKAVKQEKIKHFFLVGGCDGAKLGRNYYTELVEKIPSDCVILTLACGKFRFFDKDLGKIENIPRLLDIGQCNDAYSAIQITIALADAFKCGINDLPLSIILSWYEQKACVILLTLLYLGIKNIRLGPSLPAFITPNVLNILVENFNLMPITTPDKDLKTILRDL